MSPLFVMDCPFPPNTTLGSTNNTAQYWQFNESLDQQVKCTETTYLPLRPDIAGSLLPWPYTLGWLLIHAPLVLIRVARWEKVQALSLILAAAGIASSVQAYSSTERRPEDVLVWTPLTVILDVGAVMQLFFLVVESSKGECVNGFIPLLGALKELTFGIFRHDRTQVAQGQADTVPLVPVQGNVTSRCWYYCFRYWNGLWLYSIG